MEIKLNDSEIRNVLAEYMANKLGNKLAISPDDCWFECQAGEIKDGEVEDIHDVKFCCVTQLEPQG